MKFLSQIFLGAIAASLICTQQAASQSNDSVVELDWNPEGTRLAIVSAAGSVTLYDSQARMTDVQLRYSGQITDLSWSPDGQQIVTLEAITNTVAVWNSENGELVTSSQGQQITSTLGFIDWSSDHQLIASVISTNDGSLPVEFWRLQNGTLQRQDFGFAVSAFDLEWSPDGQRLAVADYNSGTLVFSDFLSGNLSPDNITIPFGVDFTWSPDSMYIALRNPYANFQVQVVSVQGSEPIRNLELPSGNSGEVAWSSTSNLIAGYNTEGEIHTWEATGGSLLSTTQTDLRGDKGIIEWSPFGGRLALGGTSANTSSQSTSSQMASEMQGVSILIPVPSSERLQAIAEACDAPPQVVQAITAATATSDLQGLSAFEDTVEALPADAIPPGCAADLLAVAEAIQAQGE